MKSVVIAALAAAIVLPLPAVAQSLGDTHELVWHPSGKTPTLLYRLRDRPACNTGAQHHQSGKTALPAKTRCAAIAEARPAESKDPAVAQ